MTEDHDLLTRIDENVKDIQRRLAVLNGQVNKNASDIVTLRLRDAYVAGGTAAVLALIGLVRWLMGVH